MRKANPIFGRFDSDNDLSKIKSLEQNKPGNLYNLFCSTAEGMEEKHDGIQLSIAYKSTIIWIPTSSRIFFPDSPLTSKDVCLVINAEKASIQDSAIIEKPPSRRSLCEGKETSMENCLIKKALM